MFVGVLFNSFRVFEVALFYSRKGLTQRRRIVSNSFLTGFQCAVCGGGGAEGGTRGGMGIAWSFARDFVRLGGE